MHLIDVVFNWILNSCTEENRKGKKTKNILKRYLVTILFSFLYIPIVRYPQHATSLCFIVYVRRVTEKRTVKSDDDNS